MFETVTVDEALARGKRTINIPVLAIMFGCIFLPFLLLVYTHMPGWICVTGFVPGFAFAWLYWSIMIPRWRVWAFDNVRNVHELKKRAIKERLIWPDDSFFNKTEIWTAEQREQWQRLQPKFKQDDVFHDDVSIPAETLIYYSKIKAGGLLVIGLVAIGAAVYFLLTQGGVIVMIALFAIGMYSMVSGYRHFTNSNPQITLSNDGVDTTGRRHCSWDMISNEDTVVVRHGKSSTTYFKFIGPEGEVKVDLGELAIGRSQFERLLRVYRGRYQQKHRDSVWAPGAGDQELPA